jgi:ribosomal protein S18 acetylase RimI-like enzyme
LNLVLRLADAADAVFLAGLYRAVHAHEFDALGWDEAVKAAFLDQQYALQQRGHRAAYPEAERNIVMLGADPIGRLDIDRRAGRVHVVDIALLPERCRQGIGTALIRRMKADAGASDIGLQVLASNPARRLYARLGFLETEMAPPYVTMRWHAAPAS